MQFTPEVIWAVLLVLLLGGLVWGGIAYLTRNKRLDPLTERVTKQVMDDPGPEPMKDDKPQPPGGVPSKS
jgi:hypothetical protein